MSDVHQEIESIEQWLSEIDLSYTSSQTPRISSEEKKQLLVTNRAIQQFEKFGVPILDELRKIQFDLSTLESQPVLDSEQGIAIESVNSVISSLHALLSKAKCIKQKLSVKKPGDGPKPIDVSLSDLIEDGIISAEAKLELQWRRNGEIIEGKVLMNGHIDVLTNSGWIEYKSLSTAATEIAGYQLNGWKHWKIIESDGNRTSLEKVRDIYLHKR